MSLPVSKSFNGGTRGIGGRKLAMDIMPEDRMAFRLMLESSQGHGMTGVREWLKNRFGSPEDLVQAVNDSQDDKQPTTPHSKVITPHSIPEFVIPTAGKDPLHLSYSLGDMKLENNNYVYGPIKQRNAHSMKILKTSSFESLRKCRTISVSPKSDDGRLNCSVSDAGRKLLAADAASNEDSGSESGTNDDQKSAAAVSLPHLRTHTSYGFTTLRESPNTRRRESLLFGSTNLEDVRRLIHSRMKLSPADESTSCPSSPWQLDVQMINTLTVPNTLSPSISTCSLQSDHSISPLGSPLFTYCNVNRTSGKKYKRRRSSTQTPPLSQSENSICSNDLSTTTMQTKEQAQRLAPFGEIKLSLLYNRQNSTLRLSIIKAENLAKTVSDRHCLKIFIKVCLLPEKGHRQVSKISKGTRNPSFNQQFTFKDIKTHCLQTKHLRLRICNQSSTRKYDILGDVVLPLHPLGLEQEEEVRMWRDLAEKSTNQQIGSLKISAKFEPKEDKLNITVVEASNLSRHTLTGPPDSYVKVIVKQDGKSAIKKQTRTLKSTTDPVFKEMLVFSVSPNVETLRYTTVTALLLSKERLRNDTIIGMVVLGYGSSTDNELIHWSQVLNNANSDIELCHQLQPANKSNTDA